MSGSIARTVRRNALCSYFFLAYAISWAIEIPVALSVRGLLVARFPLAVHYLASFGPFVAALLVTLVTEGRPGVGRLLQGLAKWRAGWGYGLFAIGAPPVLFALAVLVSRLTQGAGPHWPVLGQVDYLPALGALPALGLWLLTFGLGEEVGWRGFALPRMQASGSAFSASVLLGVIWALWHLPAFFYRDTYMAMGWLVVPMMLFSVTVASIVSTWLFNGTQGSLLMVVLFHGLFNFFSASEAGGDAAPIIMTAVMVFWAVRVVKMYGQENLAPSDKVVITAG